MLAGVAVGVTAATATQQKGKRGPRQKGAGKGKVGASKGNPNLRDGVPSERAHLRC
ncbi:hypothetical protein AMTR_s00032p00113220 [Amborella trichopoda]|uniref:Uncharacterized protein n=1 Tax=Amborella trichopoda TaxID=13333 RepID=U5D0A7_AMBTC|nr:hypothetical protein AMTR_s00032p00113220 [Amborella trichopoda]